MKVTTIRLSDGVARLIEREARRAGMPVAAFIREAALARAAYAAGQRGAGLDALFSEKAAEESEGESEPPKPES